MTRHRFDALSFVAGALLIAVGIAASMGPLRWPAGAVDMLLPAAAVVVGLGILLTLRPGRADAEGRPMDAQGAMDAVDAEDAEDAVDAEPGHPAS